MKVINLVRTLCILIFFTLFLTISLNAQSPGVYSPFPVQELKNKVYFLASEYLGGRRSTTDGYNIAAEYCATQFKAAGLLPLFKDEKGNPTWFQQVPITKVTYNKDISISLTGPKGTTVLLSGVDFVIPDRLNKITKSEVELVFVGYGIGEPDFHWNDFRNIDIRGKAIVVLMGTPKHKGKPVLNDSLNKLYSGIEGIKFKLTRLLNQEPAAFVVIPEKEMLQHIPWEKLPNYTGGEQYFYSNDWQESKKKDIPVFYALNPASVPKLFKDQPYSPEIIEHKGLKNYQSFVLSDLRLKSNFSVVETLALNSRNVACFLPGTDPALKEQYIVIGAHLDHIPPVNGIICPGADDNASGSIGVIELAAAMAGTPGKRPVIFVLFCGEELVMAGSHHFLNDPPVPVGNMAAFINLDMLGRSMEENKQTRAHYVESHSQYLDSFRRLISEVNSAGVNWPLIYENCDNLSGDSDHSSFDDKGIPNVFFWSGHHADAHTPSDLPERIDYEKMRNILLLVYDLTCKMTDMEKLPFF